MKPKPGLTHLLVPALFVFVGSAAAQDITFNFTGAGTDGNGAPTATASGTLTPGGAATLTFTGRDSKGDNCNDAFQANITVTVASGDTLSTLFIATSQSGSGSTTILDGTLSVTAGKGAYANLGGKGTLHVSATQNADKSFAFTANGSLTLGGPLVLAANILPAGAGNVFSDSARVSPGAWASIFGTNLANATTTWNGDFPIALGGATATVDGKAVYFWFVSPTQINFQVPDGTKTGCVAFVLNTPNGTVTQQLDVQPASPSFSMLDDKYVAAIILTPNGSGAYGGGSYDIAGPVGRFSYKTRPAKRGENVVLYGVGFGPTNPVVAAGKPFSGAARATFNLAVGITTGPNSGIGIPFSFAGLVGAGLFQINITIPPTAPIGDDYIQVFIQPNGPSTQQYPTYIPISQ
jgi:uncharacterized protein (TIGR03437 family)